MVKALWLASDQLCGKRLAPALALWLPYYERREGRLPVRLRRKVLAASPATLDRLLAGARVEAPRRGLGGTKPGSLLRTMVPIQAGPWNVDHPGWLEADTVAHCGSSLAGDFIWSVTYTDIFSQWTESRAIWNKGAAGVVARTREVEAMLPFALLGFDSDNGSEFLNHHLWRYFAERQEPVRFLRSRPCFSAVWRSTRTTTRTWSKRTGATPGRSWAASGWKSKRCSNPSTRSTRRCGARCKTTSARRWR